MNAIARFSTARPLLVLFSWLALMIGLQVANAVAGPDLRDVFGLKGTDSNGAYALLSESFPELSGDADTVAFRVSEGSVTDPAVRAQMEAVFADAAAVPSVTSVTSPYDNPSQISADGTIAYARVNYGAEGYDIDINDIMAVSDIVTAEDGATVANAAGGDTTLEVGLGGQAASRLTNPTVGPGELVGIGIAAVILFFALGSLIATTVPLISAVVALGATMAGIGLLSNLNPISPSGPILAVLLGLGIGIDYALFIVNRHRLGLKHGRSVRDSIVASVTTSGRAVVFAGVTVFIALTGMFVPQVAFLSALATSAAVTVVFSVAASVTLVPALLQLYGVRVLRRRERGELAEHGSIADAAPQPGVFARLVEKQPVIASLGALAVLAALAIPALSLRLGNADQGNDPEGTTTRIAYDIVTDGFGAGSNGPLVIAVDLGDPATGGAVLDPAAFDPANPNPALLPASLLTLVTELNTDPGVAAVLGPVPNQAMDAALIQVIPSTSPQAEETVDLVHRIRDVYIPEANRAAADGSFEAHVGGSVASNVDFTQTLSEAIPVFFAIVVGLSVIVLMIAFRSVVLPLVGAVLNLLSAAAAFGVVVAVFQWGWGHQLIGVGEGGPVEPFVPMILFALLFGLSMDYQVFLVSRIAELWHATGDNRLAVRRGLAEVSRVIVAAASIMVVVFGSFVTSEARVMKLLGLGLAVAVFLDAFVIRVVLMPAIMRLLGRANWWMPAWLDRIVPHLDVDGHDVETLRDDQALADADTGTASTRPGSSKAADAGEDLEPALT